MSDGGSRLRSTGLWLEWGVLFIGFPMIVFLEWFQVNKFLILAIPLMYALAISICFSRKDEKNQTRSPQSNKSTPWNGLIPRMIGITGLLVLYTWLHYPEQFFILPRNEPGRWLMILVLYPLASVLPQEFLYRKFYVQRYMGVLFHSRTTLLVVNALVFSFLHIMYENITAIVFTFFGGLLFMSTYLRSERLVLPWLEHSVYGLVIFSVGLGCFFASR
ncbi:CPBP family glutamic-type intramembrane protease [Desulfonatronum parangueonense]